MGEEVATETIEGQVSDVIFEYATEHCCTLFGFNHPIIKKVNVGGIVPVSNGDKVRIYVDLVEIKGIIKQTTHKRELKGVEIPKKIELLTNTGEVRATYIYHLHC